MEQGINDLRHEAARTEVDRIKRAIADREYFLAVIATFQMLGKHATAELFIGAVEEQRIAIAVAAA